MRKVEFVNNCFYHIYNRGTEKRKIFLDDSDYSRFLLSMKLMNYEQDGLMIQWRDYKATNTDADLDSFLRLSLRKDDLLVRIVCFSLLPNHYHFILEQAADKGIEKFMHRIGVGYSMFFNKKYQRSGSLFQGTFKATHIKATHHLLYLSAYVNCNSEVHGIAEAEAYRWSSFPEYIGRAKRGLCESGKKIILDNFKDGEDYKNYAEKNAKHFFEKKMDEEILLDVS